MLDAIPAFVDGHVSIIRPTEALNPIYLGLYLNSLLGQLQTERGWTGSSGQIELRSEVISDYVVWKAPKDIQEQIATFVKNSHTARKQSKQLLEIAKRGVEIAIEQDEKTAETWIHERVEHLGIETETG